MTTQTKHVPISQLYIKKLERDNNKLLGACKKSLTIVSNSEDNKPCNEIINDMVDILNKAINQAEGK